MADKKQIGKVLFSQEEITKRAKEIGKQIDKDYEGEEVIFLGTLKGSVSSFLSAFMIVTCVNIAFFMSYCRFYYR